MPTRMRLLPIRCGAPLRGCPRASTARVAALVAKSEDEPGSTHARCGSWPERSAVDLRHLLLAVARPGHVLGAKRRVERGRLLGGQRDGRGAHVLLEVAAA